MKNIRQESLRPLFGELSLHRGGMVDDDRLPIGYFYVDFGDDLQKGKNGDFDKQTIEAAANGLSGTGIKRLKESIKIHKQIFKLRRGTGGPVNVPPRKVELDVARQPVRPKVKITLPFKESSWINTFHKC